MMTQIPTHNAGANNTVRKRSNNSPSLQSWASCSEITLRPYEVIRILDELTLPSLMNALSSTVFPNMNPLSA